MPIFTIAISLAGARLVSVTNTKPGSESVTPISILYQNQASARNPTKQLRLPPLSCCSLIASNQFVHAHHTSGAPTSSSPPPRRHPMDAHLCAHTMARMGMGSSSATQ
eukprot:CAMPEP_0114140708 /NCGR_PEP_ID=MMETSP0043_2-20121206/17527_1 /TAXON_ID=464988 /ORGANISM="Hemiselmis andersenii, Strain CCMP644" /LENGTH=107 /DNA_ID=CAMNT_0001234817 /DNA_START=203 /DNA_END=526 /DNA_ORIENTATION=+